MISNQRLDDSFVKWNRCTCLGVSLLSYHRHTQNMAKMKWKTYRTSTDKSYTDSCSAVGMR